MNSRASPGEPEITDEETTSYLSGRTNEELAAAGRRAQPTTQARANGARARASSALPDIGKIRGAREEDCCRPSSSRASHRSCDKPPSGPKWVHEIKHDGYRMQARIDGAKIKLLTRKIARLDRALSTASPMRSASSRLGSALIDGEVVVEDAIGLSSFNNLQARSESRPPGPVALPRVRSALSARASISRRRRCSSARRCCRQVLAGLPPARRSASASISRPTGPTMLEHACRLGLEGIISKRKDLPYRSGRGEHWLKSKCRESQEFVILGYVPSTAASKSVGSLRARLLRRAASSHMRAASAPAGRRPSRRALWKELDKISGEEAGVRASRCRPAPRRASSGSSRVSSAKSNSATGRMTT